METFADRIKEFIKDDEKTLKSLATAMGLKSTGFFYSWTRGKTLPLLDKAVILADYFKVSLDYLFGRTDDFSEKRFKPVPSFDLQFKKILKEFKISQYKVIKDKACSNTNIYKWLKLKSTPKMESLFKLADYFGVTLDYLVGRE